MKKSDFWFDLPQEQIAQTPIEPRGSFPTACNGSECGKCSHHHFYDVLDYLKEGDLLVDTIPALFRQDFMERRKTPAQTLRFRFWNRRKRMFGKHW